MADENKQGYGSLSPKSSSADEHQSAAEANEADLRAEKLRLEVQSLQQKLSHRINWLDIIKAASGPVAVLGLIASTILGVLQIGTAREAGLEDRYQKEIAHLGASSASERLTGVTGLSRILADKAEAKRHREAVEFLVNALTVEQEPVIRGAIAEAIGSIDTKNLAETPIAGDAARLLVSRNRTLSRLHNFSYEELTTEGADASKAMGPLQDSGKLIAQLVRKGVPLRDLAGISCISCDFSGASFVTGTDFSNAVLAQADFSGAELRGSDFSDAVLVGTNFSRARLENAKLGESNAPTARDSHFSGAIAWLLNADIPLYSNEILPNFSCAHMSGANLAGRPLLVLHGYSFSSGLPNFARFDQADLSGLILNPIIIQALDNDSPQADEAIDKIYSGGFSECGFFSKIGGRYAPVLPEPKRTDKGTYFGLCQGPSDFSGLVGYPDPAVWEFAATLSHAKGLERANLPAALKGIMERHEWPRTMDGATATKCSVKSDSAPTVH
jgi:uncharacterized protein YjbI with pentapeptide repeats